MKKFSWSKKLISLVLAGTMLLSGNCIYAADNTPMVYVKLSDIYAEDAAYYDFGINDADDIIKLASEDGFYSYSNLLSPVGKAMYDALSENAKAENIQTGTNAVECSTDISSFKMNINDENDRNTLGEAMQASFSSFLYDHPEIGWMSSVSANVSADGNTGIIQDLILTVYSYTDAETIIELDKQTEQWENNILKGVDTNSHTYDKLKYLHDTICTENEYDFDALEAQPGSIEAFYAHSIYGVIHNKKSVCEGYAKVFKLLCNDIGIPCVFQAGFDSSGTSGHAWNITTPNNEQWYYADLTWDDQKYGIIYNYFLCGSDDFDPEHSDYDYHNDLSLNIQKDNYDKDKDTVTTTETTTETTKATTETTEQTTETTQSATETTEQTTETTQSATETTEQTTETLQSSTEIMETTTETEPSTEITETTTETEPSTEMTETTTETEFSTEMTETTTDAEPSTEISESTTETTPGDDVASGSAVAYAVEGGNIYFDTDTGEIVDCDTSVVSADIPSVINGVFVTAIKAGAFASCKALTSVTIPDSVTDIPKDVFADCTELVNVNCGKGSAADDKTLYPENVNIQYVEAAVYGDADNSGSLDSADAAMILQKVLKSSYVLDIEKTIPDYEKYIDVDKNGKIEAADAAMVLQKVLKSTFIMECEK